MVILEIRLLAGLDGFKKQKNVKQRFVKYISPKLYIEANCFYANMIEEVIICIVLTAIGVYIAIFTHHLMRWWFPIIWFSLKHFYPYKADFYENGKIDYRILQNNVIYKYCFWFVRVFGCFFSIVALFILVSVLF